MNNQFIVPQQLVDALSVTLFHSIWQGAILVTFTILILSVANHVSANRRYQFLLLMLSLFCVMVTFTFHHQLSILHLTSTSETAGTIPVLEKPRMVWQGISSFVYEHNTKIVWFWLAVVIFRTLQLAMGLRGISQLKNSGRVVVDEIWNKRVMELAKALGIARGVQLAESTLVKVPQVIGHFSPLILMPIGLSTALATAEVEAILAHELAHIHRKDYLVNILVSIIEITFFFNPAILWFVAMIKEERENCCDDIAVELTNGKVAYVKALVACEAYQQKPIGYAMAFSGKGSLLVRVNRLLSGQRPSINKTEKSLVAIGLLGIICLATAFTHQNQLKKVAIGVAKSITITTSTTTTTNVSLYKPSLKPINKTVAIANSKKLALSSLDEINVDSAIVYLDTPINKNHNHLLNYNRNYNRNYNTYQTEQSEYADRPSALPRLDSLKSLKTSQVKSAIAKTISFNNDSKIKLTNGEEKGNNDIAAVLAKKILQAGLAEEVKSFKMTAEDLILNSQKLTQVDFQNFKDKYIKYFNKGTTVYYNFDAKIAINIGLTI